MRTETYLTVQEYRSNKGIVSILMKLAAIALSIYGMSRSFAGLVSLTLFTNLSNIFMDLVLFGFMIHELKKLKKGGKISPPANGWYILKYMATTSITLTLLVYLILLAPTNTEGFVRSYLQNGAGSLCVHLLAPLLAILDFIIFDYHYESNRGHILFSTIPPLAYVAFVVLLAEQGYRWDETMKAPYNFLNYGAPTGWFGFDLSQLGSTTLGIGVAYIVIIIAIIFLGIGMCYIGIKNSRRRKMLGED